MKNKRPEPGNNRKKILFHLQIGILLVAVLMVFRSPVSGQAFYKGASMIQASTGFGGYYPKINAKIRQGSYGTNPAAVIKHASIRFMDPKTRDSSFFKKNVLYSPFSYGFHYEYGFQDFRKKASLGIGAFVGTRTFHEREPIAYTPSFFERKWAYYIVMVECKAHLYTKSRWDPYLNTGLGIQLRKYQVISVGFGNPLTSKTIDKEDLLTKKYAWQITGEFSVGDRYYFSNNVAMFGELGFGLYYAKLGLNLIISP